MIDNFTSVLRVDVCATAAIAWTSALSVHNSIVKPVRTSLNTLTRKLHGLAVSLLSKRYADLSKLAGRVHDRMWLLGNLTGGYNRATDPAVPVGWLLAIALRYIHTVSSTDNPTQVWESAVELAIDFAASMDSQRYNTYDGIFLDAPDFLPALEESLKWRELFTLPQVPPLVLPTLRDAISQIVWPRKMDELRRDVDELFRELEHLLEHLSDRALTAIPLRRVRSAFPLLWQHSGAPQGTVNTKYLDPFGTHPRDHDKFVFFQTNDQLVMVLPSALAAAAGCEAVFRLVWDRAEREAGNIVADTIEKSVVIACRQHTAQTWEKVRYRADGTELEIDGAVRDGQEIVVFEAKAKMLTSDSRTGNMMAFIDDYTKSFLALLRQLVRHDWNIKRGLTPLTVADDVAAALRVTKIAVSPLSYGPASDHFLTNALMHSIAQARLTAIDGALEHVKILNAFNKMIEQFMRDVVHVAARDGKQIDLVRYMMQVFWFDLGQLLYALQRGRSVIDGLSVLRHLSYGTRDFWTEAAIADRQGLSKRYWHPPSGRDID